MSSKINIDIKEEKFYFELKEAVKIGNEDFRKGKIEVTVKALKKEGVDVENDKTVAKDAITVKVDLKQEKGKEDGSDVPEVLASDLDAEVKYKRGWISDSFKFEKLGDYSLKEEQTKELKVASDLWGMNYLAWVGLLLVLIGVVGGGYYWWTSSQQEEEEENV